jgi:hypothetical protein
LVTLYISSIGQGMLIDNDGEKEKGPALREGHSQRPPGPPVSPEETSGLPLDTPRGTNPPKIYTQIAIIIN